MSQGPLFLSCLLCLNLLHLRLKVDKKSPKLFETSHEQILKAFFVSMTLVGMSRFYAKKI